MKTLTMEELYKFNFIDLYSYWNIVVFK